MAMTTHSAENSLFPEAMSSPPGPSWIVRALEGMKQGWRAHLRYERLSKLSDEALDERGLRRDQIGREAFFGDGDL